MALPASASGFRVVAPIFLSRKLLGDTGWVMLANLAQAAGPFVGLLAIARLHGMEAAGQFAYAQALTAPLAQFLNLQLKALILTHDAEELPLAAAISVRLLCSVPGAVLAAALQFASGPLSALWMGSRLVDSWGELFQANHQRTGKMRRAAISVVLRSVGLVALLVFSSNTEAALMGYLLLSLLLLFSFDCRQIRHSLLWKRDLLQPLLQRGFLLGIVQFLQAANSSIPRIVLEKCTDAATLGIFVTASVILQCGNLLASAFGQALLPAMTVASTLRIATWALIPFGAAILALLAAVLGSTSLLTFFHLAESPVAANTLFALSLAQLTIWPAATLGYALTARRLYSEMLWLGLGLIAVSGLSSWFLVLPFGSIGATMSLASSGLTTVLICFWILSRSGNRKVDEGITA